MALRSHNHHRDQNDPTEQAILLALIMSTDSHTAQLEASSDQPLNEPLEAIPPSSDDSIPMGVMTHRFCYYSATQAPPSGWSSAVRLLSYTPEFNP